MPTFKKNSIRFDALDFLSGLSPQYTTSVGAITDSVTGKLNVASAFHPYRALGMAAPGFAPTDLTGVSVVTGLLRNVSLGAESSTYYAYAIAANNLLHRIALATKTITNAGSWPHTISTGVVGVAEGNDCITYNSNVGGVAPSNKIANVFYSWNDTTASNEWNVGMFNTASGAFTDNFMTTVPATPLVPIADGNTKPHPMVVGADDILYIADGNLLHGYDGGTAADGTFSDSVLTLPSGYVITTMAKTPDYLAVFAYYAPAGPRVNVDTTSSGPAICALWNYLDLDPTYVIPISDNAVGAAFEFSGTVGCFTVGTKPLQEGENRFCTLQILNGLSFEIKQLFIGNPPIHGGVEVIDDSIQWNSDGAIHSYGTPLLDAPPGLNKLNKATGATSGLLRTVGGITGFQLISSGTTTSGGAQYLAIGTYGSSGLLQTGSIVPDFAPLTLGKIKRVGVRFAKTSTGGRALNLYLGKENGTNVQIISGLTDVTSSLLNTFYDRTYTGGMLGSFQELSLLLEWQGGIDGTDAPIVRYVDVEFETENLIK